MSIFYLLFFNRFLPWHFKFCPCFLRHCLLQRCLSEHWWGHGRSLRGGGQELFSWLGVQHPAQRCVNGKFSFVSSS